MRTLASILILALFCSPLFAEESAEPPTKPAEPEAPAAPAADANWQAVVDAHGLLTKAREAMARSRDEARKAGDNAEARADAERNMDAARKATDEALALFLEAFAESSWEKRTASEAPEIMEAGLWESGDQELQEGDPEIAVAALAKLVKELPQSDLAIRARLYALPVAFALTNEPAAAAAKVIALAADASDADARHLHMTAGDLQALGGDLDAAAANYAKAIDGIGEDLDPRDPLSRIKGYGQMRANLVGKPAPALGITEFLGEPGLGLDGLEGKVVALDFWATWCGPCRAVMPHLDELARSRKEKGLAVIGLTRFYPAGYLPAGKEGEAATSVRDMKPEDFKEHLTTFRARFGSTYPYAVGVEDDFKNYGIIGIPTIFLIDRQGVVRFVKIGSGNDRILDRAIDLLLAENSAPAQK